MKLKIQYSYLITIRTAGNVLCLFIFIQRNLELKKIYKELVTSLLVWDLVFIILGDYIT